MEKGVRSRWRWRGVEGAESGSVARIRSAASCQQHRHTPLESLLPRGNASARRLSRSERGAVRCALPQDALTFTSEADDFAPRRGCCPASGQPVCPPPRCVSRVRNRQVSGSRGLALPAIGADLCVSTCLPFVALFRMGLSLLSGANGGWSGRGKLLCKFVFRGCSVAPENRRIQTRDAVMWRNPEARPLPRVCVAALGHAIRAIRCIPLTSTARG